MNNYSLTADFIIILNHFQISLGPKVREKLIRTHHSHPLIARLKLAFQEI